MNLGDEAMGLLREHGLCEGYAQALLRVPGIQGACACSHVIEEKLSVPVRNGWSATCWRACPFLWRADGI